MAHPARRNIYIIGAGFTGVTLAAEIRAKKVFGQVAAFLDDDPGKIGTRIDGVAVLGPIDAVAEILKTAPAQGQGRPEAGARMDALAPAQGQGRPEAGARMDALAPADEAIVAIPSASRAQLSRIFTLLKRAKFAKIRIVPQISQIVDGDVHLIQARDLDPEDLLAREPVRINLRKSLAYLRGKRVLITGAGGSIGSELCRQLLEGGVERMYLFGHGENSIYEILRELRLLQEEGVGEKTTIVPILGELQDRDYVSFIVTRTRAHAVFHAAAHKHVPLLEDNPVEAVKNNVFGTLNVVEAARQSNVERFVFISTDKAVEPACVYGASKLLAEEIVLRAGKGGRNFIVVRFGNVLGSRGSILPLFQKQILKGGPVTVTDPAVKRYFMTIPEATSLVLQAGGVGCGGEVYLLDMGEELSIKELAEQMIHFYGYEPDDIRILYTGLRPGEKLTEKLYAKNEVPEPTAHPKILKLKRQTLINGKITSVLERLRPICFHDKEKPSLFRNRRHLRTILQEVIPDLGLSDREPEY